MDLYRENNEFFEIIGEDSLKSLKTWKNYEELLKICKFIVFRRKDDKNIQIDEEFLNNKNIIILEKEYHDISSTELRNMEKNNEEISAFVKEKIQKLIEKEYLD